MNENLTANRYPNSIPMILSIKVSELRGELEMPEFRKEVSLPDLPLPGDWVNISTDLTHYSEVIRRNWIVGGLPVVVLYEVLESSTPPNSEMLLREGWTRVEKD